MKIFQILRYLINRNMTWKEIDRWEDLKGELNKNLKKKSLEIKDIENMVSLAKDTIKKVLLECRNKDLNDNSKGLSNLYSRLTKANLTHDKVKILAETKGNFSAWDSDLQEIFGKLLKSSVWELSNNNENLVKPPSNVKNNKEIEKDNKAVSECEQLINKIGDQITLEDKSKIEEARNAFEQLNVKQQERVNNYQKLIKAESDLNAVIEKDNKAISECEQLINEIHIKNITSEEDLDLWCPEIPNAYKKFSSLSKQSRSRVNNGQKLLNIMEQARKVEDKRIEITNQFIKDVKTNKVVEWSNLSTALHCYHNFFEKESEKKIDQNALNDALKQLFENRAKELEIKGKITSKIKKKINELNDIYCSLPEDKRGTLDKSYLEKFENAYKANNVNDSISRILDDKVVKSEVEIKEVKKDFEALGNLKDKVNRYDELIEYEKKLIKLNESENTIGMHRSELTKIKEPLKNLSAFYSKHSKKFNDEFNKQVLLGLNLCLKYDSELKYKTVKEKTLKEEFNQNKVDTLKKLCERKWITSFSRDYLLFIISIIECKKLYFELTDDNINYEDPSKDELYSDGEKFLNETNNLPDKIKSSLSSLFEAEDSMEKGNSLVSIYSYLNNSKDLDENSIDHWILRDWFGKEHHEVVSRIIRKVSDKELTPEQKTCIKGLKIFDRADNCSDMEECKNPVWNITNGKPDLSANDLKQGDIGDCWLIATLISIVKNNPDNILKCFPHRDQEIDKYSGRLTGNHITVRLYEVMLTAHRKKDGVLRSYARPVRPLKIKMSATIYKKRNGTNVSWPNFIEKAVSIYRGRKLLKTAVIDENIGNFGKQTIEHAKSLWLERVEGNNNLKSGSNDGIVQAILLGTTGGGVIGCSKYLKDNLKEKLIQKNAGVSFSTPFEANGNNFITNHEYAIISVDDNNIYLINPHNGSETLSMPIDTFYKYCSGIEFGHSS